MNQPPKQSSLISKINDKRNQIRYQFDQAYYIYISRPIRAFFRMPGARGFGVLLTIFLVIVILSVIDLRVNYVNPETGNPLSTVAAIYAVFALLVFETPFPLPHSWITQIVFFAVPISGLLLLGQGVIRVGSSLLNVNLWDRAMASTYSDHVIICGLGKVGFRVARWVVDLGEEVVVIESNDQNPFLAEVRSWDIPVIVADARRPEVLKDAGILEAESIVPCTSDDLVNLSVALEARQLHPPIKVVLRMFDNRMADNIERGFDIHTAFSIPDLSAPAFAAAATRAPLDYAFAVGKAQKRLLTITEFTVVDHSVLCRYSVERLESEFNVAVITHRHGEDFTLHPKGDVVFVSGDQFVISAPIADLNEIANLTPPTHDLDLYEQKRWPRDPIARAEYWNRVTELNGSDKA